jgi:rubredoxin
METIECVFCGATVEIDMEYGDTRENALAAMEWQEFSQGPVCPNCSGAD